MQTTDPHVDRCAPAEISAPHKALNGVALPPSRFLPTEDAPAPHSLVRILREGAALPTALQFALRHMETNEASPGREASASLYRTIAALYGLLGHEEDAAEWFGRSQRCAMPRRGLDATAANDTLRASLAHLSGNYVATIRLVNGALSRHSRRAGDPCRNVLLALLGASYLRLGQIAKAEFCVTAILRDHPDAIADVGRKLGLILHGEIHLWSIVRTSTNFRGHLLFVDDLNHAGMDREARLVAAQAAFKAAFDESSEFPALQEIAHSGLVRIRLLTQPRRADWDWLIGYQRRMTEQGLAHMRDLARLNLAILYLVHEKPSEARFWLAPLAQTAMSRPGTPFEHDVLFCAAVAAERSGDPLRGMSYLNEYNIRLRTQNLSRVPLPPPNIDLETFDRPIEPVERGGSENCEDPFVARFSAFVEEQPAKALHWLQFAAMEGIARRTLEYRLRRLTGKSPKQFVTSVRLKLAQAALRNETQAERMPELARSLGFKNERAFAGAFQRAFGMSPIQAARMLSAEAPPSDCAETGRG